MSLETDRLPPRALSASPAEPGVQHNLTPAAVRAMILRAILLAGFAAMAAADLEVDVRAFYHEHDASKFHKVSTVLFHYKGK